MTLIDLRVVNMPAFGKMNKGELTAALQALGEVPPETWTLTELRVRLADPGDRAGDPSQQGPKS